MRFRSAPEFRGTDARITRRSLLRAGLATGFSLTTVTFPAFAAATGFARWSGAKPANFILPDLNGTELSLAAKRGTPALVHFWATWCEPCREELPALRRLSERAGNNLNIIALSVAEPDMRVRRFLETVPLPFPVLLDRERSVAKSWNVTTLPTTFLLDKNLQPKFLVETDFDWDKLETAQLLDTLAASSSNQPKTKPSI